MTLWKKHFPVPKLFFKYLMNYLMVVLCISTVLICFSTKLVTDTYEEEVTLTNELKMEQIRREMDSQLLWCSQTASKISQDPAFFPNNINDSAYSKVEAIQTLDKYKSFTGILGDITLYYFQDDIQQVYSTKGTFPKTDMERYLGVTCESLDELGGLSSSKLIYPQQENNTSSYLHYVFPKPFNFGEPYCLILFSLNCSEISSVLTSSFQNYDNVYFFILNGESIALTNFLNEEKLEAPSYLYYNITDREKKGIYPFNSEGVSLSILKCYSEYTDIAYAVAIDEEKFRASIVNLQYYLFIFIVSMIILGTILSIYMSFRSYIPVKQLLDHVKGQKNFSSRSKSKEFQAIFDAIDASSREKIHLQDELLKKNLMLEDYDVTSLLLGKIKDEDTLNQIRQLLQFKEKHFIVCCIMLDNFSSYAEDEKEIESCLALLNKQLCQRKPSNCIMHSVFSFEPDMEVVVLNSMDKLSEDDIQQFFTAVQDNFSLQTNHTVSIAVGSYVDGPLQIKKSFRHAKFAVRYRMVVGWNSFISYEQLIKTKQGKIAESLSEENIQRIILSGNLHQFAKLLETIFVNMNTDSTPEQIINEYFKIVRCLRFSMEQSPAIDQELLQEIEKCQQQIPETAHKMYDNLLALSSRFMSYFESIQRSRTTLLGEKVMDYLQKNFTDCNITLNSIADAVGVTPSYLSRCFKEETGQTVMNYLDNLRMQLAQKYLLETDTSVKEIVKICGYVDTNNFLRKFKKIYGITPTTFRNQKLQHNQEEAE